MHSLDFRTVVALGAVGFLIISAAIALAAKMSARTKGLSFLLFGGALLILSSLNEVSKWPTRELGRAWASHSVALSVLGFAFAMAGIRRQLGYGMPVRWYLSAGLCCALGVEAALLLAPTYMGFRTIAFSLAHLLYILPLIASERARPSPRVLKVFLALLSALATVSAFRLVFAVLRLERDDFLSVRVDSWLFLAIIASGLAAFSVIVSLIARARPQTRPQGARTAERTFSLAGYGLSATESRYIMDALAGLSSKEIAARYGVADSTVRNTMSRSYRKCGVADLRALTALVAERGVKP